MLFSFLTLYLRVNFIDCIMEAQENKHEMFYPHVSVDCVLLGANDDKLCVLLVERQVAGSNEKHYKLPGSLIYESEDLDTAAYRVLNEATGLKRVALKQFRSFGSPAHEEQRGCAMAGKSFQDENHTDRDGRLSGVVQERKENDDGGEVRYSYLGTCQ